MLEVEWVKDGRLRPIKQVRTVHLRKPLLALRAFKRLLYGRDHVTAAINRRASINILQVEVELLGLTLIRHQLANKWHAVLAHSVMQRRERQLV